METMFILVIGIVLMGLIIVAIDEYSSKKNIAKSTLILLAFTIVAALCLIGSLAMDYQRDKKVVSSESIGIAQAVQFFPSAIRGASTTQITTDKGTFLVVGTFQLITGDELFIEKRASGKNYICDHRKGTCNVMDR